MRRFPSGQLWSDPRVFMAAIILMPVPRRVHTGVEGSRSDDSVKRTLATVSTD
jgi:hypothetical protein